MKKKLFGTHIEPNCEYCSNNVERDGKQACRHHLTPGKDGSCRKFSYDPLRRTPIALPLLPDMEFDEDEFKL